MNGTTADEGRAKVEKRGFKTSEAREYLGVSRRFFETHMYPLLKDKGVKAGTSIIYERSDLDAAWDSYKDSLTLERSKWEGAATAAAAHAAKKKPARRRPSAAKPSTAAPAGEGDAFKSVVARILGRDKR